MSESKTSDKPLDRQFIVAASVIGTVYVLVVLVSGALLGDAAASVAGVFLTAFSIMLLRKFETLRFRVITDEQRTPVDVPRIRKLYLLVFILCCFGIQFLLAFVTAIVVFLSDVMRGRELSGSFIEGFILFLSEPSEHWLAHVLSAVAVLLAHGGTGYICGRFSLQRPYAYAALASVSVQMINIVCIGLPLVFLVSVIGGKTLPSGPLPPGSLSMLDLLGALYGTYIATRRKKG
jgi:hypothetical protein